MIDFLLLRHHFRPLLSLLTRLPLRLLHEDEVFFKKKENMEYYLSVQDIMRNFAIKRTE
jgi:hypothetical protein